MVSHIFLTGFMGAGKSTVGRLLAQRLDRPLVDLDAEIERREGASTPEIFRTRGEDGFREAEHRALDALAESPAAVVATGGGVVLREDNQVLLRRLGTVVYLAVTPDEAIARLGAAGDRPLLAGGGLDAARRILGARLSLYSLTADHVVNTTGQSPAGVAETILRRLDDPDCAVVHVGGGGAAGVEEKETPGITVDGVSAGYDVIIGTGLIDEAGFRVKELAPDACVAVVADDRVWGILGGTVGVALDDAGVRHSLHLVPAGESSKSWQMAGTLLDSFAAAGVDRGSIVLAVGGGVVGDLAGFSAATYMRGIPVVQLPTTLLAQVDSSVGGKTGVDLAAGKNLAGAFWPPSLVLADIDALASLPAAELTNGLVEIAKGLLIGGGDPLQRFERDLDAILARDTAATCAAVLDAVAFKARIVTEDLRESGLRECLNFGHTLGHALEVLVGYGALSHGLAVAEGMRFASLLATHLGVAGPGVAAHTAAILERLGAGEAAARPVIGGALERLNPAALLAAMKGDKKSRAGVVRFVLLEEPGRWRVVAVDDDAVLLGALETWFTAMKGGV